MFRRWRRRKRQDFADEIQSHLELEADDLIRDGVSPDEAPAAARRRFGSITAVQERHYEAGRFLWADRVSQDLRCGARSVAKHPIASAVAVLSLAAGIGSTTATLAIRDTVFRNPPPLYQAPEQLSEVFTVTPRGFRQSVPAALYRMWTAEQRGAQSWAAATAARREDVRTSVGAATLSVRSVTPNLFGLLGVQPTVGGVVTDSRGDAGSSVVISHAVWQRLFEGRPDVVGQPLWINDQAYRIAAVMPERFWFLETGGSVWLPLDITNTPGDARVSVMVRRLSGLSADALRDSLRSGVAEYAQTLPQAERALRADIAGVGGTPLGRQQSLFFPYLLGGCVVLTWLIACANVAILMIARWTAREREIAVRVALGAGRGRLIQLLLIESLLVAALGGILGVGLTFALRSLLLHNAGPVLADFDTSIRPHVLLDAAALTILTGLLAGLGPASYEMRRLLVNPLRSLTSERVRQRWRHSLVIAEIAATVALLVVMGQMIDGYRRQVSADMGFVTDNLLVVRIESADGVRTSTVLDYVNSLPGITSVSVSTSAPLTGHDSTLHSVTLNANDPDGIKAEAARVSTSFFAALGVPIRSGRAFSTAETEALPTVALVNETLARRLWPRGEWFGSRIWLDGRAYDVIGIVADYLYAPISLAAPTVFLPLSSENRDARLIFLIRTPTAAGPLITGLRRDIARRASGHVVASAITANEWIALGGREILAGTVPLVPLITIGLLLTVSGVYAVLAFAVARRSKEFALRTALGASSHDIVQLVTTHSLRLILIGSAFGVALTFALTRVVRASGGAGSMFDTPGWPAFAVPMLIMLGVGAIATWIPSLRALRAQPATLLRVD
jgi:predicted permease